MDDGTKMDRDERDKRKNAAHVEKNRLSDEERKSQREAALKKQKEQEGTESTVGIANLHAKADNHLASPIGATYTSPTKKRDDDDEFIAVEVRYY